MSDNLSSADQHAIDRFWHNYLSILEKAAVPKRARTWYRKHIQAYISAHTGLRLAAHLPQQLNDYLNAKGRAKNLSEWPFRQIAGALR